MIRGRLNTAISSKNRWPLTLGDRVTAPLDSNWKGFPSEGNRKYLYDVQANCEHTRKTSIYMVPNTTVIIHIYWSLTGTNEFQSWMLHVLLYVVTLQERSTYSCKVTDYKYKKGDKTKKSNEVNVDVCVEQRIQHKWEKKNIIKTICS